MAFSPDSTLIANSSMGGKIRIHELKTGETSQPVAVDFTIRALTFSPDGKRIAFAGNRGLIGIWTMGSKEAPRLFRKEPYHDGYGIAFSHDGNKLAVTHAAGAVAVHDAQNLDNRTILVGHADTVMCAAFSPEDAMLATGGADRAIRLWDSKTGRCNAVLSGHEGSVSGLAFTPDGLRLASAGADGTVRLWDTVGHREVAAFRFHNAAVNAIAFSGDGERLVSGAADGTIHIATARRRAIIPDDSQDSRPSK
jgi:WD40 repeat protein